MPAKDKVCNLCGGLNGHQPTEMDRYGAVEPEHRTVTDLSVPTKDSAELRDEVFAGKSLKTNLRDIVAQACTGHNYFELCEIVADPNNDEMLDGSEVENIDRAVNLLGHLYLAHTAAQVAAADTEARLDELSNMLMGYNKALVNAPRETRYIMQPLVKALEKRFAHLTTGQKEKTE